MPKLRQSLAAVTTSSTVWALAPDHGYPAIDFPNHEFHQRLPFLQAQEIVLTGHCRANHRTCPVLQREPHHCFLCNNVDPVVTREQCWDDWQYPSERMVTWFHFVDYIFTHLTSLVFHPKLYAYGSPADLPMILIFSHSGSYCPGNLQQT